MKKLLIAIFALTVSASAIAQHNHSKMEPKAASHEKMDMDCVMMKNGKMMMKEDGKTMPMNKDKTMKNGTKVKTDGTIKMKCCKATHMKDGDMMDMKGKMGKIDEKAMKNM